MSDQPGAIWIPNGNAFPGRNGLRPRYVLLHGTAGGVSAQNIATYFASTQGGDNPVSSHYVIGQNGTIVQCVSEADGAWANGALTNGHAPFWNNYPGINPNNLTISIEHCKPSLDNSDALTPAQQAASFKLQTDICDRWGIPKKAADANGGITGHFSLDPVNRQNCPGPYPWDALWTFLNGVDMTQIDELKAQVAKLTQQLSELRNAWNIVVPEKNGLVADKARLTAQVATLTQQLTDLQNKLTAAQGYKPVVQQVISLLQKLVS